MEEKKRGLSRDLLIHPGETIADLIEDRGITQKELAQKIGISEEILNDVIHGRRGISKELAMGLERAIDVPCSFWMNLQSNYEEELLSIQDKEHIA